MLLSVCCSGLVTLYASAAETIEGTDVTWGFDNFTKVLTFEGEGSIPDFTEDEDGNIKLPWDGIAFTSIVFGEGIDKIGNYAFYGSVCLEELTVPQNINSIGKYAFQSCKALKKVNIESSSLEKIEDSVFSSCTTLTEVTLPDTVTEIGQKAFYRCTYLESINIPQGLTAIGDNAFNSCTSIKSFTANESLKKIGARSFYCCESLETVVLSENTTSIGNSAFDSCTKLSSIALQAGTLSVSKAAFSDCESLSEVLIAEGTKAIEDEAFDLCSALKSITVPFSVETIGTKALGFTNGGKRVEGFTITGYTGSAAEAYADNNGFSFNSLGEYTAASGTINETVSWDINDENDLVISGDGEIGDYSVYSLPPYMHNDFNEICVLKGITSIGAYAFFGNTASFYIPSSVTHIGDRALGYAFDENGCISKVEGFELICDEGNEAVKEYAKKNGFKVGYVSYDGKCGEFSSWSYDPESKILTVTGTGKLERFTDGVEADFDVSVFHVAKVIIKEGITEIGDYAFANFLCDESGITFCIPQSVTSIAPTAIGYIINESGEPQKNSYAKKCTIAGYAEAKRYTDENEFEFAELDDESISAMAPDVKIELSNSEAPISIDEESKLLLIFAQGLDEDTLLSYFAVGEDITLSFDSKITTGTRLVAMYGETVLGEYTVICMGDCDGNGIINSADALCILRHAVGETELLQNAATAGDLNFDGVINSNDALNILFISVGQTKLADYMPSRVTDNTQPDSGKESENPDENTETDE